MSYLVQRNLPTAKGSARLRVIYLVLSTRLRIYAIVDHEGSSKVVDSVERYEKGWITEAELTGNYFSNTVLSRESSNILGV